MCARQHADLHIVERVESNPFQAGVIVGGAYRVLRQIDDGGLGILYDAEDLATGELRSLEVMHGPFVSDGGLRARFVRETRLAASIPSDYVAPALDAGQDEATHALYVVLEPLDGTTLAALLERQGPLSWTNALAVLSQVAEALRAAHARGIVHRDLKPSSVFLARSTQTTIPFMVKVLDFGIAKAISPVGGGAPASLGTSAWTAPELSLLSGVGGAIGPQADAWSFGLLAFTILTGKHYFPSANIHPALADAVLREVAVDELAPASERAAQFGVADRLPAHFDAWFARCVDRDPRGRFDDLAMASNGLAALPRPTPLEPSRSAFPLAMPEPMRERIPPEAETQPVLADDFEPTWEPVTTPDLPRSADSSIPPSRALTTLRPTEPHEVQAFWWGPAFVGFAACVGAALAVLIFWWIHSREAMPWAAAAQAPPVTIPVALRLHGSNTIGAELAPALAEAFLNRRAGAKTVVRRRTGPDELVVEAHDGARVTEAIEVAAHGSATAFEDLGAGFCDVGMSSRRIHDDEIAKLARLGDLGSAASEHVIALDGIAVIVNPVNPVSLLTRTQLSDIFSGKVRRWSDVGGKDEPIVVHARNDKSGTYDTFRHLVLVGRALVADAKRHESSEELSDAVAADAQAVGFIGLPYVRSAKPVMVQDEGAMPLLASPMTVSTEDYPLSRRLYLYVPLGASVAAHDFVDFAQSEEGQKIVEATGFVDLRPECAPNPSRCSSCPAEYREIVNGACRLTTDFRFGRSSAQLDTRALRDLPRIAALMGRPEYRGKSIVLLGFSDSRGSRADNLALSQERASVVTSQLRARGLDVGIERGFGADMPVSDNTTDEGRERNRRVEVWLR